MSTKPAPRLDDALWTSNYYRQRMTLADLRHILLNDPDPIRRGRLQDIKYKKVGPGVVEVWLEDKE